MQPECSLPCSQGPATGPYPEPDESIHSFPCYFIVTQSNVTFPSMPLTSMWSPPFMFSDKNFVHIFHLSQAHYIFCPFHPIWLDHPNNMQWNVQVMKVLIMKYSPASHHFLCLRSKYSSQHPVPEHSQIYVLPRLWEMKLYTHTKQQVKLILYIFITEVFRQEMGRQILNWMVARIPQI